MNPRKSPPARDATEEVSALIETLHQTGQRLEELTAGEVDTVADRDGRTFLLRHAQDQLRHSEAAKQAAILNALPAHIALLDSRGLIISVNEAWRRFSSADAIQGPGHGIGVNYLEICDSARGTGSSGAHQVAEGIRSVLGGRVKSFSIEYPCHSPTEQHWFLLTATPLADERPNGAVVMHLNITERKRAEQALLESKEHFRFLSDLTEATRTLAEPEQIMAVMSRMLGEHLRASRCAYADVENDGEQFTILHDYTDGCVSTVGSYHLSLFGPRAVATLNSGQILVIRSVEAELLPGEGADMFNAIGIKAIITCPLVKDGSLRAMMAVHQTTPRDWTSGELTIVQEVVGRCWATIERRTAEERLRQSQALLRIAGRTARLGGWAVDLPEGRITWSDEVCAIHDAPPGTVPGFEQAFSFYAPQSRETVNKAFEACAQQGTPFDLELEVITAIGRRVWVRSIGEAQRNAAGAITRVQGAFQDITERHRIEDEIRETRNFLASIFDNIPNSIFVKDARELKFVRANAACETLTGYSEKEFLGKSDYDFFPRDQADFFVAKDRETLAGSQRVFIVEENITSKDGTQKIIQTKKFPILDKDGQPQYLLGMSEDITERKHAEQSLQERTQIAALGADVGAALTRGTTLEEMLQLCCEAIVGHLHAAFARIWTLNEREGMLELRASAGMYVHLDGPHGRVPVGKFKIGLIAQERKAHLTNQVVGDPRVSDQEWAKREGMVAFAGYPLLVENHLVGVVAMFACNPLADVTVQGLASISNNIALGIEHKQAEARIRESEAKYRGLIEQASDGIFITDARGNYQLVNSRACELLGFVESEMIGMHGSMTHLEGDREAYASRLQAVTEGKVLRYERMMKRKDGSAFPADVSAKKFGDDKVQVMFRDITDRKDAENRIKRLNRVYAMLSGINAAIVRIRNRQELLNEACRIAAIHGAFRLAWFGLLNQATGEMDLVASAGFDDGFFDKLTHAAPKGAFGPRGVGTRALHERRTFIDNDIVANPDINLIRRAAVNAGCRSVIGLPLAVEEVTVGSFILYAEEKDFFDEEEVKLLEEMAGHISFALTFIAQQEKVEYLAYYDGLTGLANRSLFLERLAQFMRSAVSGGHKLALFLVDLERFKNINDSLGRPAGDALLRLVAEWLTRNLGDANLFARVGADHFALVLPEVKQEGNVARILEKSMAAFMEHPFRLDDAVFRIAVKVGVALFPDDGADADTLFKNAEAALKKAKASGDRYLFYTQNMTATVAGKLTLENQLRQALDNEEFVLHYQPKVNLVSGKLTGAEALIRWNDPRTGLVPPGRFIPILEETGLIYEVGRWALRKAIEDYLRWRSAGLAAVRIAVNVSPLQLRNHGFIAEIKQAIGIDAQAAAGLELEITESLIMEDVRHNIASLQAIRAMGVRIAIDDFGTGFSSLSYLSKLPVDTLKIDRSFVIDMTAGPEGLALVSTIINLAHSLKLKVVAEGVETEEQSRLLRLLDCDEMQGYIFSKPVPGEIFETRYLSPPPGG